MIRSEELIDILIADLHFHNYLRISGCSIFNDPFPENVESFCNSIGIDPQTDLYHGGYVTGKHDYINQYIDDVFIDLFFRTYKFKPIIYPKELCTIQITPNGVIEPQSDLSLDLSNIFDRCTFVLNMYWLIHDKLLKKFPQNGFLSDITPYCKSFGQHGNSIVLSSTIPFDLQFDAYHLEEYNGKGFINPEFRANEIIKYSKFIKSYGGYTFYEKLNYFNRKKIVMFERGYYDIKHSHFLGEYTFEDLLVLYSILVDKCLIKEDTFLIALLFCMENVESSLFMDFHEFEMTHRDYHVLDPFMISNDLFLRFASRKNSKAFSFTVVNTAMESIQLFNKQPILHVKYGNTMPLPFLYNHLNLI